MDIPTFTVVMPAHNAVSTIGAAIASALAQNRADLELLVVDDGSTDGTADEVRRFATDPRVRLLTQPQAGPGAARNAAFGRATGRYVSMLDSDDLWLPSYLDAVSDALDRAPEAGLAYTSAWVLDDPPGLVRRGVRFADATNRPPRLDAGAFLLALTRRNFLVNSTVTVRRSALEGVGGCNTALAAAIDFELWLRIATAGYGAVFAPGYHAIYRSRPGSIQNDPRNELGAHRNLREVYRGVAEEWDVPAEVQTVARARVSELDRHIAILSGERRLDAALLVLRRRASRAKRVLWRRRLWHAEPPPEVAETLGIDR